MRLIVPVETTTLAIVRIPGATRLFEASAQKEAQRLKAASNAEMNRVLGPRSHPPIPDIVLEFTVRHPETSKPVVVPIKMTGNCYQDPYFPGRFILEGMLHNSKVALEFSFQKDKKTGDYGHITDISE